MGWFWPSVHDCPLNLFSEAGHIWTNLNKLKNENFVKNLQKNYSHFLQVECRKVFKMNRAGRVPTFLKSFIPFRSVRCLERTIVLKERRLALGVGHVPTFLKSLVCSVPFVALKAF